MKIRAGLLRPSAAWWQFMEQEGLDWVELKTPEEISGEEFSVLVAPARTGPGDVHAIAAYLRTGGAVVGPASAFAGLMECREERLRFILAAGGFSSAGIVDLELDALVPREANALRTPDNTFAVFAGEWKGGVAVVFPFDPSEALTDVRSSYRSFYLNRDRLPWERVSTVSKGGVRNLLRDALIYLHQARGFPYAHAWYYPDGHPNTFVFRIDTDGAGSPEIEELRGLLDDHGLPGTWFLDVKTQGSMLRRYRDFAGHEIGVHCDEHRIFKTEAENRSNIERALEVIRASGIHPAGFAAPYGYWDLFLGNVIDSIGFSYSSEFSWSYDTLPGEPVTPAGRYKTLQVPIHPVSVGSLRRAGCPTGAMAKYFASAVRDRVRTGDPMFFYHHPSHREWSAMRGMFEAVRETAVPSMTMAGFAEWWRERGLARPACEVLDASLRVGGTGARTWVSIVMPDGQRAIVPPAKEIQLGGAAFRPSPAPEFPADILRTREWDFREYIGQVLLNARSGR